MANQSVLGKIRKLDQERDELLKSAKKEALDAAKAAIADLGELGFQYELREVGSSAKPAQGTKRAPKGGPCAVCGFETNPAHDGRKHRPQGENKKPFSESELKELGLKKTV